MKSIYIIILICNFIYYTIYNINIYHMEISRNWEPQISAPLLPAWASKISSIRARTSSAACCSRRGSEAPSSFAARSSWTSLGPSGRSWGPARGPPGCKLAPATIGRLISIINHSWLRNHRNYSYKMS